MLYRSENCVNYLTAWGVDIDAQDNNECTPLHYAALGVIEKQNVHIIMGLLIGGADRSIKVT
jgi:ankyrin repeat protein